MTLNRETHLKYLTNLDPERDSEEHLMSLQVRMGGHYWVLSSLYLLDPSLLRRAESQKTLEFVESCRTANGGFSMYPFHDANACATHYVLLIHAMLGDLPGLRRREKENISRFIQSLQEGDGSFASAHDSEVDLRFVYASLASLAMLEPAQFFEGTLEGLNYESVKQYIWKCLNSDGGFGMEPKAESHAAFTWCALASLALLGDLHKVEKQTVYWLVDRQTPTGGFNGRPEKAPDTCYSWWCFASLVMLGYSDALNRESLELFILGAQDKDGGIADRAEDVGDPFHTFFGLAALSLIDPQKYNLQITHPVWALPCPVVVQLKLPDLRLPQSTSPLMPGL